MRRWSAAAKAAAVAHLLALAATLGLLLWPGLSPDIAQSARTETADRATVAPGSPPDRQDKRVSLIEARGPRAVLVIVLPVALTTLGLSTALFSGLRASSHRMLLWGIVAALGIFCWVLAASIGLFYLPATLVLAVAAALAHRRRLA